MSEKKINTTTEVKPTILVVDDESNIIESYKLILENKYNVLTANCGTEALNIFQKEFINLILLDIMMPDMDGLETLKKIKETNNDVEVIMVTAVKTVRTAIQAVKLGAYDYISKPFDVDDLLVTIDKALEKQDLAKEIIYLKSELKNLTYENMVGKSNKITQVFDMISELSNNESTILITGESGTGKELISRADRKSVV
jgi:two-component system, NtrC family, response regulator AtoC